MKQTDTYFSPRAKIRLENILDYLISNWSVKTKDNFLTKLDRTVSLIQTSPKLFPKAQFENIRKAVVTKQITIFYRINKDTIEIITLFDTRQNPRKIKSEFKAK